MSNQPREPAAHQGSPGRRASRIFSKASPLALASRCGLAGRKSVVEQELFRVQERPRDVDGGVVALVGSEVTQDGGLFLLARRAAQDQDGPLLDELCVADTG